MKGDIILKVKDITKDYGQHRGNFDITFDVKEGEALGIVGENGAGKTTLMRQIMGFIKQDKGEIKIYNYDSYKDAHETKKFIGYVPGEINFPDVKTGNIFLNSFANISNVNNFEFADYLIKKLQLDIRAYPKRMSKGMKQKTAIVTALMKEAPLILMDEPTTGLDPLMRDTFLEIIADEHKKGKTIIMSSNTIEELEKVCDRVIFISRGKIIEVADLNEIKNRKFRDYKIEFIDKEDFLKFKNNRKDIFRIQEKYNQLSIRINKDELNKLFEELSDKKVKFISEINYDLSKYFDEKRKGGIKFL